MEGASGAQPRAHRQSQGGRAPWGTLGAVRARLSSYLGERQDIVVDGHPAAGGQRGTEEGNWAGSDVGSA
jgi:hypothetical protein